MNFLTTDYQLPETNSNNYMKLQKGENRFRILSPAITGWVYWDVNNKPIRTKEYPDSLFSEKPKHFWCMVVYNCNTEEIQLLEISQSTIQKSIKALLDDKDWGEPENYDIKIIKTGELKETKYQILGVPHSAISEDIKSQYESMKINLEAVFDGENPFGVN